MLRAAIALIPLTAVLTLSATAAPGFATVRVTDIYRNLSSTQTLLTGLQKERDEILKDERGIHLRKILGELEAIQKQLQAKRDAPVDDAIRKLAQDFEVKRQEAQTLQEEFQIFDAEKKKEINRKMVLSMRSSLEKINAAARRISQEKGFEGTFDSSGNSNTGVPVILYAKNAEDITEDVIAVLKDAGDPSGPFPAATPAPAGAPAPNPAPAPAPATPSPTNP